MRSFPDDNLSYPVLLKFEDGNQGSGFFLSSSKGIHLITAKHVLLDTGGNFKGRFLSMLSHDREIASASSNYFQLDLEEGHRQGGVVLHPAHDVAAIKVASRPPKDVVEASKMSLDYEQRTGLKANLNISSSYSRRISISSHGPTTVRIASVKKLEDVLIGNDVFLFGYPVSIGLLHSAQFDYERPLVRAGIVSGKYEPKASIILDCSVYKGDSGGPVLEVSPLNIEGAPAFVFRLCGVVSEFIPYEVSGTGAADSAGANSGYSIATAMDPVLEMLGLEGEATGQFTLPAG